MKLRNKETGLTGILTFIEFNIDDSDSEIDLSINMDNSDGECIDRQFYSLDELKKFLRDWEDYTPKEPLIKDEKIRKAVRAWAEANEFGDKMAYIYDADKFGLSCWQASIEFNRHIGGLEDGKEYSFDELCGEEEE